MVPVRKQYRRDSASTWTVHVLVPCGEHAASWTVSDDEYQPDTLPDLTLGFRNLRITPHFHRTTLSNYTTLISSIPPAPTTIIMNLCDGTETDNRPGTSVLAALEKSGHAFTGADKTFNDVSCSKLRMKELLDGKGVRCPKGCIIAPSDTDESATSKLLSTPYPAILKPDVSYGAIGVTYAPNPSTAQTSLAQLRAQFGSSASIVVEEFVEGREFTALVVDDVRENGVVYPVLERVFEEGLEAKERFLSQDVYWNGRFVSRLAPAVDQGALAKVARDAYLAVGGNGYARVDMRMSTSGDIYVLEVNALCGVSGGEDSSVGNILKQSGETFEGLLVRFLEYAAKRADTARRNSSENITVAVGSEVGVAGCGMQYGGSVEGRTQQTVC